MSLSWWRGVLLVLLVAQLGPGARADSTLAAETQRAFYQSLLQTNDHVLSMVKSLNEGMTETRESVQAVVRASHHNLDMPLQIAATEEKLMRYIDYKFNEVDGNVRALQGTMSGFLAALTEITRALALPPTNQPEEVCSPVDEMDQ